MLQKAWIYARRAAWTIGQNLRWTRGDRRFLVARHAYNNPYAFADLLAWLETAHPALRARFELQLVPGHVRDLSRFALHIPWLQDPVQHWSPRALEQANRLAAACDRRGIPIVNRADRLVHAAKSTGAARIASAGLRTPRIVRAADLATLALPLFVRDDWGHGGRMLRADTRAEAAVLPVADFRRPIAIELVDVRDPRDGLYRKYRYLVAGERGAALAMHVQKDWIVRGTRPERSDALLAEERAFLDAPNPFHTRFVAATAALGLDVVAFDYSLDARGEPIVWEANPFPILKRGRGNRHRWPAIERAYAAMVELFHLRAGLSVPRF